jgi:tetratricopeptide (TPR) repeat protein
MRRYETLYYEGMAFLRWSVLRPIACAFTALVLVASGGDAAASSSALELVRMAQAHERTNHADLAVRRYMEALSLDPTCEEAYLGLGSLRARLGDLREAERVYSVALEHVPQLRVARTARAYLRRALGANSAAIEDLLAGAGAEDDVGALKVLASWYGEDGQTPAQLAVWRRIVARAGETQDAPLLHEARTMVRALVILVGTADPAASPPEDGKANASVRRTMSVLARRGHP